MPQPSLSSTGRPQTTYADVPVRTDAAVNEAQTSGVSWPAVAGGAFVTAALSLILLALGAGLGLSSVSPWSNAGASATTISRAAIIWLIFMQIASGAMGGYLAGRLRTKWASLHTDEVYFRDTAHGFLAWAVAFVVTAAFLTTAATFMVGATAASAADGRGETRAECANQQREERPQQRMRRGFAGRIRRLLLCRDHIRDTSFSLGLAEAGARGNQLRKIAPVCRRDVTLGRVGENACGLGTRRPTVRIGLHAVRTEQRVHKISTRV